MDAPISREPTKIVKKFRIAYPNSSADVSLFEFKTVVNV